MAAVRLRALERRWRETGWIEDEAALLRERVLHGDLAQLQLELLSYVGYEAARLATGATEVPPERIEDWAFGLGAFGLTATARACFAACRVEALARERVEGRRIARFRDPLALVQRWIREPTQRHAAAVVDLWTLDLLPSVHWGPGVRRLVAFLSERVQDSSSEEVCIPSANRAALQSGDEEFELFVRGDTTSDVIEAAVRAFVVSAGGSRAPMPSGLPHSNHPARLTRWAKDNAAHISDANRLVRSAIRSAITRWVLGHARAAG